MGVVLNLADEIGVVELSRVGKVRVPSKEGDASLVFPLSAPALEGIDHGSPLLEMKPRVPVVKNVGKVEDTKGHSKHRLQTGNEGGTGRVEGGKLKIPHCVGESKRLKVDQPSGHKEESLNALLNRIDEGVGGGNNEVGKGGGGVLAYLVDNGRVGRVGKDLVLSPLRPVERKGSERGDTRLREKDQRMGGGSKGG